MLLSKILGIVLGSSNVDLEKKSQTPSNEGVQMNRRRKLFMYVRARFIGLRNIYRVPDTS